MHIKFGETWTCGSRDLRADRQTDRQTYIHTYRQTCSSKYSATISVAE